MHACIPLQLCTYSCNKHNQSAPWPRHAHWDRPCTQHGQLVGIKFMGSMLDLHLLKDYLMGQTPTPGAMPHLGRSQCC